MIQIESGGQTRAAASPQAAASPAVESTWRSRGHGAFQALTALAPAVMAVRRKILLISKSDSWEADLWQTQILPDFNSVMSPGFQAAV
ncbi:hypothetical protein DPEC_G00196870 [Dallia pectoralis]|uniref:Uncharacterized protein n=1 Tax=Dallia pectoralis TaxID=75939 RepID=A0ACC2G826_DALPE|nr:hypothetical protein DPEC_G00196870 [Dallia pectoralis]